MDKQDPDFYKGIPVADLRDLVADQNMMLKDAHDEIDDLKSQLSLLKQVVNHLTQPEVPTVSIPWTQPLEWTSPQPTEEKGE
jgi:hypothetical protein